MALNNSRLIYKKKYHKCKNKSKKILKLFVKMKNKINKNKSKLFKIRQLKTFKKT